ncbi:hypothetical protein CSOJ01_08378 [Colletotrichum sojae]|uniref:Uncharacterized protein n=1 Tax=Colletotrichum sojae TaxID=2175907 RepID=A0A8H6J6V5_9PEZI|nr:hypothetical protein CSOJ01_08378 [Colletotrichum sojae]
MTTSRRDVRASDAGYNADRPKTGSTLLSSDTITTRRTAYPVMPESTCVVGGRRSVVTNSGSRLRCAVGSQLPSTSAILGRDAKPAYTGMHQRELRGEQAPRGQPGGKRVQELRARTRVRRVDDRITWPSLASFVIAVEGLHLHVVLGTQASHCSGQLPAGGSLNNTDVCIREEWTHPENKHCHWQRAGVVGLWLSGDGTNKLSTRLVTLGLSHRAVHVVLPSPDSCDAAHRQRTSTVGQGGHQSNMGFFGSDCGDFLLLPAVSTDHCQICSVQVKFQAEKCVLQLSRRASLLAMHRRLAARWIWPGLFRDLWGTDYLRNGECRST